MKTLKEYILLAPYITVGVEKIEKPEYVMDKKCPENLDTLTFGKLATLHALAKENTDDLLFKPAEILLGISSQRLLRANPAEVLGFTNWWLKEVKRIFDLFNHMGATPTSEEKQAGIDELNFGVFGIMDWYAQRMGIIDHDDVLYVPWLRIYRCMGMDAAKAQFEKRLRKVIQNKHKRR